MPFTEYIKHMARPTVLLDAFAAVAEPKRRRILEVLGSRHMPVTQLVDELHWPQPTVSKHLAVLRKVGLVHVERQSRQKVYSMNAEPLKTIHEWTAHFEQFWTDRVQSIKARAEAKMKSAGNASASAKEK